MYTMSFSYPSRGSPPHFLPGRFPTCERHFRDWSSVSELTGGDGNLLARPEYEYSKRDQALGRIGDGSHALDAGGRGNL